VVRGPASMARCSAGCSSQVLALRASYFQGPVHCCTLLRASQTQLAGRTLRVLCKFRFFKFVLWEGTVGDAPAGHLRLALPSTSSGTSPSLDRKGLFSHAQSRTISFFFQNAIPICHCFVAWNKLKISEDGTKDLSLASKTPCLAASFVDTELIPYVHVDGALPYHAPRSI
jgi:hypothetical protein